MSPRRSSRIELRVLGCGDAFASGGRAQTCFLIRKARFRMLLDFGATAPLSLVHAGIDASDVEHMLITHPHGDHIGGIPFFLLQQRLVAKREHPLAIIGPPGLEKRVHASMTAFYPGAWRRRHAFPLDFVELAKGRAHRFEEFSVQPFEMAHDSGGTPSYGLRIEIGGKVIAYTGDTEWCDNIVRLADGADLLICEAAFYERQVKNHLTYKTLLDHRDELNCQRIMLTHLSEEMIAMVPRLELQSLEDGMLVTV